MKIAFLLTICLLIQVNNGSGPTLPEQLQNAQSKTDQLHSHMTSVLVKFRMDLSNILKGIINESLSHIVKALEASNLPDTQISSEELDSGSEMIGKQISRCSAQADSDIEAAIKQFFVVFNPIHEKSLSLLNTVLEQMVEWNIFSDPKVIVDRINEVLEAKNTAFESISVPSLEDEFRKFKKVLYLIPSSVSRCVTEAINN